MLYYLFEYLEAQFQIPGAGLFQFITFRAAAAIILSLIISMIFGKRIISSLKRRQVGETIRELGLKGENQKAGTPTMGGVIIILAIIIPCLLLAKLDNVYIQLMLFATIWMAIIGFVDDYIKVFKKDKKGLKGIFKVLGQIILGAVVAITMLKSPQVTVRMDLKEAERLEYEIIDRVTYVNEDGEIREWANVKSFLTNVPFMKGNRLDYLSLFSWIKSSWPYWIWIFFIPFVIFIVTAVSNAANLTDGLDGLATGVSAIIALTLGVLAYVSTNTITAEYLNILYLPNASELVIFSACFLGACIGFLWYNAFPAQVFMGDTGSLTIGGIIATLALLIRKELLIPLLCGIFLLENLSVVMQVFWFKYTKRKFGEGRRIFRMSPLHHHYQKMGMHESKIVTRFWIVGILLAVITIVTLKIR